MNLLTFQTRFRLKRRTNPVQTESEEEVSRQVPVDDDFDELDATQQLSRIIYVKKNFGERGNSVERVEEPSPTNFNMSMRVQKREASQADKLDQSPEFPKTAKSQRGQKFFKKPCDQPSNQNEEYQIKITPPKEIERKIQIIQEVQKLVTYKKYSEDTSRMSMTARDKPLQRTPEKQVSQVIRRQVHKTQRIVEPPERSTGNGSAYQNDRDNYQKKSKYDRSSKHERQLSVKQQKQEKGPNLNKRISEQDHVATESKWNTKEETKHIRFALPQRNQQDGQSTSRTMPPDTNDVIQHTPIKPREKSTVAGSHQPYRHEQTKQNQTSSFTARRLIPDRSEKDLSVYNESNAGQRITPNRQPISILLFQPPQRKAISPIKPRETLISQAQKMLSELRKNPNRKYQDSLFPANPSIIFNTRMEQQQDFRFLRLHQIYHKYDLKLYHRCDPASIIQGRYSSPNLFSSLVILAQQPSRIANILFNQEIQPQGFYYVSLCKEGHWRFIIVDDFLPVRIQKKKHLLFMHTSNHYDQVYEVWPAIIQKAISKIYGTYEDIMTTRQQGIKQMFKMLTGLPCSQYEIGESGIRPFFIILESSLKQKHIVVLEGPKGIDQVRSLNLQPNHSYQAIDFDNSGLVLRNYNEESLDRHYTWQQLNIFRRLLIFKQQDGYYYISRTLRHLPGHYSQIRMEVSQDTNCYMEVWQLSPVYFRDQVGYQVAPWMIEIRNITEGSIEQEIFVRESGQKIHLTRGNYAVRVHLCFPTKEYDFTLTFYGDSQPETERQRTKQLWQHSCNCRE